MIMSTQEAAMYAELIRRLEDDRDNITDRLEMLKDELKEYLTAQGVSSFKAGTYTVRWTEYEVHRFDTKALKAAQPDLYNKYEVTSKQRRFSIV